MCSTSCTRTTRPRIHCNVNRRKHSGCSSVLWSEADLLHWAVPLRCDSRLLCLYSVYPNRLLLSATLRLLEQWIFFCYPKDKECDKYVTCTVYFLAILCWNNEKGSLAIRNMVYWCSASEVLGCTGQIVIIVGVSLRQMEKRYNVVEISWSCTRLKLTNIYRFKWRKNAFSNYLWLYSKILVMKTVTILCK